MLQKDGQTCNESDGCWLPLIEYSVKSGVSLSTIRRKIKTNSIPFRLERGKYLILFQGKEIAAHQPVTAFSSPTPMTVSMPTENKELEEDSWSMRMISDAFEHALKEKDERIRCLEQRNDELGQHLSELRLLVRVLEEKYEVRY